MEKKCKVWNAFLEDYNDNELQLRYDNFVKNEKAFKQDYNDKVPIINEKLEKLQKIEKLIFESSLLGIVEEKFLSARIEIKKEIDDMCKDMGNLEESFKREEKLTKQYKETSDHRLYVWYKALKAVAHPEVKTYSSFKTKWGNKII
jgi:hypothetical protein